MEIRFIWVKMIGVVFFVMITLLLRVAVYAQSNDLRAIHISFKDNSDLLQLDYRQNVSEFSQIEKLVEQHKDVILTGNGHIMLVATLTSKQTDNPISVNMAAIRASVVRSYIKKRFRILTNWNFSFYFVDDDSMPNSVMVSYVPEQLPPSVSSDIFYSLDKNNITSVNKALDKYGDLPYLMNVGQDGHYYSNVTSTRVSPLSKNVTDVGHQDQSNGAKESLMVIYYRWDNSKLDSLYLDNLSQLHLLDSVLTRYSSRYIDSLTIVAYSSPEGDPLYNYRLSERRANTMRDYIIKKYPNLPSDHIFTDPRGENWDGVRKFAENDSNLPSKDEVMSILNADISNNERQKRLVQLDRGTTYYRYILPNYYKYLRNAASIFIAYNSDMRPIIQKLPIRKTEIVLPSINDTLIRLEEKNRTSKYYFALRTNLLFDMIGAFNLGVEVPIGKHFSVIGDFAYGYWRSANNLYALQVMEWGLEGRYWFNVSENRKEKSSEWMKPLRGWNVGVYGVYCSRYDVQFIDGYQGDGFWSAGITAGYAMPIAKNFALEFSLGAGYFYTPEYRHYHRPEYDAAGNGHLMWQETWSFGTFTLTKARVSLVWLIGSKERRNK